MHTVTYTSRTSFVGCRNAVRLYKFFFPIISGYYPFKSNNILFNRFNVKQYIPLDLQFVYFSRAKFAFTLARRFLIHEEKKV